MKKRRPNSQVLRIERPFEADGKAFSLTATVTSEGLTLTFRFDDSWNYAALAPAARARYFLAKDRASSELIAAVDLELARRAGESPPVH